MLPPALAGEPPSRDRRVSKACLKNVASVLLILIYLLLMAVAVFLVYQTITDFREKLKHPVMSVSYQEVQQYDAPGRALDRVGWRGHRAGAGSQGQGHNVGWRHSTSRATSCEWGFSLVSS